MIRAALGLMVADLSGDHQVRTVMIAGNTVMHHLFCGLDVAPLAGFPFEPVDGGGRIFAAAELGWKLAGDVAIELLPCLGGLVGGDLLAGVLATGMAEDDELAALVDLGTNGEIVLGNSKRLLCASTAAGPGLRGRPNQHGHARGRPAPSPMWRSGTAGRLPCDRRRRAHRACCGSGLVDAAAAGLDLSAITPAGRLTGGAREMRPGRTIAVTQADIRELQLAKAAIAAGMRLLAGALGSAPGRHRKPSIWPAPSAITSNIDERPPDRTDRNRGPRRAGRQYRATRRQAALAGAVQSARPHRSGAGPHRACPIGRRPVLRGSVPRLPAAWANERNSVSLRHREDGIARIGGSLFDSEE